MQNVMYLYEMMNAATTIVVNNDIILFYFWLSEEYVCVCAIDKCVCVHLN